MSRYHFAHVAWWLLLTTGCCDVRGYVARREYEGINYREVRRCLSSADLPELARMLEDPGFAEHWGRIAILMTCLSKDETYVPLLIEYAKRKDDWAGLPQETVYRRMLGKRGVLRWLGLVGGEKVSQELRQIVSSPAAAKEFAKEWITAEDLPKGIAGQEKQTAILLAGSAAVGLVLTQKPENLAFLEQKKAEVEYIPYVDAMATKRLIEEVGFEGYLDLLGTPEGIARIQPYLTEYNRRNQEYFQKRRCDSL